MSDPLQNQKIVLHIDDGSMGGGGPIPHVDTLWVHSRNGDKNDLYDFKSNSNYFSSDRIGIFHYIIFGHKLGEHSDATGYTPADTLPGDVDATADGDDSFIADANLGGLFRDKEKEQASMFMHELGHQLGLVPKGYLPTPFGGIDSTSEKYKNYKSCMTYYDNRHLNTIDYSDGSHGSNDFDDWDHIDLSRISTDWNVYEG